MNEQRRTRIGNVLLALTLVALLVGVGSLLVEQRLTLWNELAFGIAGALLLAFVILEPVRTRTWVTSRQARYGSNAVLMTLALLVVLGVANFLADRHPYRIDVTANRILSLSPQTIDTLRLLEGPVRVVAFFPGTVGGRERAADLLDQYRYHYPNLQVEFHDPEVEFARAQEWGVTDTWRPTIFIIYGDRKETIHAATELEITSALVRLIRKEKPKVYFITGHGEPALDDWGDFGLSTLKERMEQEGIEVAPLNLLITATVPADARAVVLVGPRQALKPEEVERLTAYLDGGGAAMILMDPATVSGEESPALSEWLEKGWGVSFRRDVVIDIANYAYPMPTVPVATPLRSHPVGQGMPGAMVYFVEARSIARIAPPEEMTETTTVRPTYTALIQTSTDSWGETSWDELSRIPQEWPQYTEGEDTKGPLDLAVILENSDTGARLALFGDIHFCTNVAVRDLANGDLFMNTLNWLIQDETLISLRPNEDIARYVTIRSNLVRNALFLVLVILLPLLVLAVGGIVWATRRVRR